MSFHRTFIRIISGNNTDKCPVEGHIPNLFVISLLIGIEYNTSKFIQI